IENAVKVARAATKKAWLVSFKTAFHGRTLLDISLTGKEKPYREGFGPLVREVLLADYADPYRDPQGRAPADVAKARVEELDRRGSALRRRDRQAGGDGRARPGGPGGHVRRQPGRVRRGPRGRRRNREGPPRDEAPGGPDPQAPGRDGRGPRADRRGPRDRGHVGPRIRQGSPDEGARCGSGTGGPNGGAQERPHPAHRRVLQQLHPTPSADQHHNPSD